MAVTLRYFTEFGKPVFQHVTASICGGIHARVLYFVVRVRCRRYKSSRSLSHLLMSFLFLIVTCRAGRSLSEASQVFVLNDTLYCITNKQIERYISCLSRTITNME